MITHYSILILIFSTTVYLTVGAAPCDLRPPTLLKLTGFRG